MILVSLLNSYLQLPPGTRNPDDNAPLDFTDPFNVIMFIILPIAAVVLYIVWRKQKKKDRAS
ncbi:adenylosuccinate synthetase [Aestuariivivens sediminicola]|uniref:adenylosuccinate synthetase n=1 Tax=Aestuariivivens sediminicola TaxID=2913560 RepID=UPI001F57A23E|nr:adenylosuccinate synthetase [Aestuariivivens sediminicola]